MCVIQDPRSHVIQAHPSREVLDLTVLVWELDPASGGPRYQAFDRLVKTTSAMLRLE
ncbi:MAG: hypothetical protein GY878_00225 [Fuerstiella sp.]|nr:hypothetical protein [Fuerstiella sp.]